MLTAQPDRFVEVYTDWRSVQAQIVAADRGSRIEAEPTRRNFLTRFIVPPLSLQNRPAISAPSKIEQYSHTAGRSTLLWHRPGD